MKPDTDLIALVTLLAIALFFWTIVRVAGARRKYGVAAPATAGDPAFERTFRVQMNTLEGLAMFLPALWLFAAYWDGRLAAALGGVWLIGRTLYVLGYSAAAEKRALGFAVQGAAFIFLFVGAAAGVGRSLLNL